MAAKKVELITVRQAAEIAGRTRAAVHTWIKDGYVPIAHQSEDGNGQILIDRAHYERILPGILEEMAIRLKTKQRRPTGPKPYRKPKSVTDATS